MKCEEAEEAVLFGNCLGLTAQAQGLGLRVEGLGFGVLGFRV